MEKSYMVTHCQHIVENIFDSLPARDLGNCACVCKFWNFIALSKLKQRNKIVHFYQVEETIVDGSKIVKGYAGGEFESQFHKLLSNLSMKPAICIAFATSIFWHKFEELFPSYVASKKPKKRFKKMYDNDSRQKHFESALQTILKNHLPRQCDIGLYIGDRILTSCNTTDGCKESIVVHSAAITGYFFPESAREAIQLCKRKEYGGEVLKVLANQKDLRTSLVLVEHKFLLYFSVALRGHTDNLNLRVQKFDVFESGVVQPVQIGSSNVPVFWGSQLHVNHEIPKVSDNDTVAFIFWDYPDFLKKYSNKADRMFCQIPVAGLIGSSEIESDDIINYEKSGSVYACSNKSIFITFKNLKIE